VPSVADRLRAIVGPLPDGAAVTLPADTVRAWLAEEPALVPSRLTELASQPLSWRERFRTAADDVRLGAPELAEALGRSRDWVYRATSPRWAAKRGRNPLPCSKLDGVLVFTAGAVRRWLQASAVMVNPEPEPPSARLRVSRVRRVAR